MALVIFEMCPRDLRPRSDSIFDAPSQKHSQVNATNFERACSETFHGKVLQILVKNRREGRRVSAVQYSVRRAYGLGIVRLTDVFFIGISLALMLPLIRSDGAQVNEFDKRVVQGDSLSRSTGIS